MVDSQSFTLYWKHVPYNSCTSLIQILYLHFYIPRSTPGIWTNLSTEELKFESPSKWNSYEGFNLDRWWDDLHSPPMTRFEWGPLKTSELKEGSRRRPGSQQPKAKPIPVIIITITLPVPIGVSSLPLLLLLLWEASRWQPPTQPAGSAGLTGNPGGNLCRVSVNPLWYRVCVVCFPECSQPIRWVHLSLGGP